MPPRPSLSALATAWLGIGCQSFGGGATTFTLIERTVVARRQWLTPEEYVHFIALAQLSPGINLLGLTILIGKRLRGVFGVIVSLAGLLLPSVAITVCITAVYARVAHRAWVQAALHGIIPATVGLGLLTAFGLARTRLRPPEGRLLNLALLLGSAALLGFWHLPVIALLVGAGLVGAVGAVWRARR